MTKEIDRELVALIEDMGCLCGILDCKGHEDLGGFILLEVSRLPTQEPGVDSESNPPRRDDVPGRNPSPPPIW